MSVAIVESCISCGACEWECPNEAISPGAPRPVVDESRCTECYGSFIESQCVVVCPVGAITVKPESIGDLTGKFQALFGHRRPQNTWDWQRSGENGS
jgi:ferredoxin